MEGCVLGSQSIWGLAAECGGSEFGGCRSGRAMPRPRLRGTQVWESLDLGGWLPNVEGLNLMAAGLVGPCPNLVLQSDASLGVGRLGDRLTSVQGLKFGGCRSGRNIPKLKWNKATALNTYDVLRADRIVMDKASLDFINSFYGAKSEPPATADPTPPPASKEI
jgi:hypothetical protein